MQVLALPNDVPRGVRMFRIFATVVLQLVGGILFGLGVLGGQQAEQIKSTCSKVVFWRVAPFLDTSEVGLFEVVLIPGFNLLATAVQLSLLYMLFRIAGNVIAIRISLAYAALMSVLTARTAIRELRYFGWVKCVDDWTQMIVVGFPMWPVLIALPGLFMLIRGLSLHEAMWSTVVTAIGLIMATALVLVVPFSLGRHGKWSLAVLGTALYTLGTWLPLYR